MSKTRLAAARLEAQRLDSARREAESLEHSLAWQARLEAERLEEARLGAARLEAKRQEEQKMRQSEERRAERLRAASMKSRAPTTAVSEPHEWVYNRQPLVDAAANLLEQQTQIEAVVVSGVKELARIIVEYARSEFELTGVWLRRTDAGVNCRLFVNVQRLVRCEVGYESWILDVSANKFVPDSSHSRLVQKPSEFGKVGFVYGKRAAGEMVLPPCSDQERGSTIDWRFAWTDADDRAEVAAMTCQSHFHLVTPRFSSEALPTGAETVRLTPTRMMSVHHSENVPVMFSTFDLETGKTQSLVCKDPRLDPPFKILGVINGEVILFVSAPTGNAGPAAETLVVKIEMKDTEVSVVELCRGPPLARSAVLHGNDVFVEGLSSTGVYQAIRRYSSQWSDSLRRRGRAPVPSAPHVTKRKRPDHSLDGDSAAL